MFFPIDAWIPIIQNIQVQESTYNLENTPWYVSPYINKKDNSTNSQKFVWNIDAWIPTITNVVVKDSTYTLEWAAPKNWFLSWTTIPVDKSDEPILTWQILSWDWVLPSINNLKIDIKAVRKKADETFWKWFLDNYSDEYLGMLWASEVDKIFDPKMDKFFVWEFLKSYFNIKLWYRSQNSGHDAVVVQWARSYQYQLELLSQWRSASQVIAIINYELKKYTHTKQRAKNDFWEKTTYSILRNIFWVSDNILAWKTIEQLVKSVNSTKKPIVTWTLFSKHIAKNWNWQAFDVVFVDKNWKLIKDTKNYKVMQDKFVWPTKYLTNAWLCKSLWDCAHIQRYYPD